MGKMLSDRRRGKGKGKAGFGADCGREGKVRREEKWEGPPEKGLVRAALWRWSEKKRVREREIVEGLQLPMGAGGCSPIFEKRCCFFFRVF